jgi:hypothetical protein
MSTNDSQNDQAALTLAAIRWYVNSLEKLANDIYITRRTMYPEVEAILRRAFRDLGVVRKSMSLQAGEACPPGYVDCNGVCLPDCDPMEY